MVIFRCGEISTSQQCNLWFVNSKNKIMQKKETRFYMVKPQVGETSMVGGDGDKKGFHYEKHRLHTQLAFLS